MAKIMKIIYILLFIFSLAALANETDLPLFNSNDTPLTKPDPGFKIVNGEVILTTKVNSNRFDAKQSIESSKSSTVNYDLENESCIVIYMKRATKKRIKKIDRLLSHFDVKYKIYRSEKNGFRNPDGNIVIFVLKEDKQKTIDLFAAAEKIKLLK